MTETATVHPVRSVCRIREVIEGHSVLSEIYIGRYRSGGLPFRSVFVRATCSPVPDRGTIIPDHPDHEVIEVAAEGRAHHGRQDTRAGTGIRLEEALRTSCRHGPRRTDRGGRRVNNLTTNYL